MPIDLNGETAHKVVVIGRRTLPDHLFGLRPPEWGASDWRQAGAQGEPGEPLMDWVSFSEAFAVGSERHRVFFFGHGIDSDDLQRLGPQTEEAVFKRVDHVVVVLDPSTPTNYSVSALESLAALSKVTALGLRGFSGVSFRAGQLEVPVTSLDDAHISDWFRSVVSGIVSSPGRAPDISSVVEANIAKYHLGSLPERWEILLSPIWEPGPNGTAVRRVFLAPESMRQHYFEGQARALLQSERIANVIDALSKRPDSPQHPLSELRELYCDPDAPTVEVAKEWSQELGGLSLLLAHAARCGRVGATEQQLIEGGLTPDQSVALSAVENSFVDSMSHAPVDALVTAMAHLTSSQAPRQRPWWRFW